MVEEEASQEQTTASRQRGRGRGRARPLPQMQEVAPGTTEPDRDRIQEQARCPERQAAGIPRDIRTMDDKEMEALQKYVEQLKLNRSDGQQAPFIPMGAIARLMPIPEGVSVPNNKCSIWRKDLAAEDRLVTRQSEATKQGTDGSTIACVTNFVCIDKTSTWTMFQEGEKRLELSGTHPRTGENVVIIIRLTGELPPNHPQAIHILNTLNNETFDYLGYHQLGRNFYDPSRAALIEKHNIELWPGAVSSIRVFDAGFLMLLDVSHRVLRRDSVLDYMMMLYKRNKPEDFYRKAAADLIGTSVLTRYNNKTYRIDDIIWDKRVCDTFKKADGSEMSYKEYYMQQYHLEIQDSEQPLLLSKAKRKGIKKIAKDQKSGDFPRDLYLVPELCAMTGLTETMRADRTVMQDLAEYTRPSPNKRVEMCKDYIQKLLSNQKVNSLYETWGIRPDNTLLEIKARVLPHEDIETGSGMKLAPDNKAEWTQGLKRLKLHGPIDLMNWAMIFLTRDAAAAEEALKIMKGLAPGLGMRVEDPYTYHVQEDTISSFTQACASAGKEQFQMLVVIVPNDKKDRYDAIKKLTCLDYAVPTQVINAKTLGKQKQLQSIIAKVQMQIVCKMGGSLWRIKIPLKNSFMVIGYDCYHDSAHRGKSVGAAVYSLDQDLTKWYAQCEEHGESRELVNNLADFTRNALKKYFDVNGNLPDRIFFYRDGVGDGQVPIVFHHEIPQLMNCFEQIMEGSQYKPKLTFTIVTKRTNVRFFKKIGQNATTNPDPGTVVDSDITRPERYDYYMVPQSVNQGTVTPVAYNVIYDESGLKPDHLQRMSYKLCHLYYNWQGTIRVPAPCQYAHKLAFLIGQSVHARPNELLMDKLFFL